jgi:long-chain fatty acid transport protein
MAGAYGAISDDTSGVFYNPAGTRFANGNSVSASGNSLRSETKTYQGALGSANYQRDSNTIQPNFFGVVQHMPFGTFGFSYVITDSTLQQQDQQFINPTPAVSQYTLNYNNEINTYNIGPSLAVDVNKDLKAGATLYYFYKKRKTINNQAQTLTSAGQPVQWDNIYFKDEENGFRPILGVIYAPEDAKYSVGLALSKIFIFSGSQYSQKICRHTVASSGDPCYVSSDSSHQPVQIPIFNSGTAPEYPLEARLGVAFFPSNALLISADIDYFSAVGADAVVYQWNRQAVFNFALGAEYYFSHSFAVRTGAYSDFSNVDSQGLAIADDKVNLYGLSLSGAWFSKYSSISFGVNYEFGSGDSNISTSGTILPLKAQILTIFLGTSYNY